MSTSSSAIAPTRPSRCSMPGATRAEILAKTGSVLGCAGANLTINEGEISVLMGLSGSGKSTLMRAVNGLNKVSRGSVLVRHGGKMVDVVTCEPELLRQIRQGTRGHGVPAIRPLALAHGQGECRLRPRACRQDARSSVAPRSTSNCSLSISTNGPTNMCMNSQAACSSASAWRARLRPMRRSSSWTSPFRRSIL